VAQPLHGAAKTEINESGTTGAKLPTQNIDLPYGSKPILYKESFVKRETSFIIPVHLILQFRAD
jgi:hypothetical protein